MPTTLYPNFETGATALEQRMLTVDPRSQADLDVLDQFAPGSGLDGVFLAGALSLMITHERNCVFAFRALANATVNPMLKAKYKQFEAETTTAVEAYESAIVELGGDPNYVSPAAMVTEAIDTKMVEALLLTGVADPMTLDVKTISIVASGAVNGVMNGATLHQFSSKAKDGASKDMLEKLATQVTPACQKHLEWCMTAQAEMAAEAAKHPTASKWLNKAEELAARATRKSVQP